MPVGYATAVIPDDASFARASGREVASIVALRVAAGSGVKRHSRAERKSIPASETEAVAPWERARAERYSPLVRRTSGAAARRVSRAKPSDVARSWTASGLR